MKDFLAFKPDHDGSIAYIKDNELVFSLEGEKDSFPRYSPVTTGLYIRCMQKIKKTPDVIAHSGWDRKHQGFPCIDGSGYRGIKKEQIIDESIQFFGHDSRCFFSTHERSHIMCAYGMSPFPQKTPCYVLIWEGRLGSFYLIDKNMTIKKIGTVLEKPGIKYSSIYAIADPLYKNYGWHGYVAQGYAGKIMALAAYGSLNREDKEQKELIKKIFDLPSFALNFKKKDFVDSGYYNIGVESQKFKDLAKSFSDQLFNRFYVYAKKNLTKGYPLLIAGGCGLNCDWNSAWKNSDLFEDVFVPPCANDSGSAIGTAIDAMYYYTGKAKIKWSVYAGEEFILDKEDLSGIEIKPLNLDDVAKFLFSGNVIAWVQGKYEIGPRALGNRSLIASPLKKSMHFKLNKIKKREPYRPIAPICLEEDFEKHFDNQGPSPYMLYFQKVKTDRLPAITHVDNSARAQSVNINQNKELHALLSAFKRISGVGVLCNTSLNFNGYGFINRMSDLVKYAKENKVDAFVVNNLFYKVDHL